MHEAEVLVGTQKDRGHGRVEVRTTYVLPGHLLSAPIKKRWFGIEYGSIVKQVSQRTVSLTKAQMAMNKACDKEEKKVEAETTTQTRYYLTSLSPLCPEIVRNVQRAVRNHWGIENGLHHVLDVDFGQDAMQDVYKRQSPADRIPRRPRARCARSRRPKTWSADHPCRRRTEESC